MATPAPGLGRRGLWRAMPVILAFAGLTGCESIGYYLHVAGGQLKLLADRQPVDRLVAELASRTEEDLQARALLERLQLSREVLVFAEQTLGLPVGGRYRSYVDLDRDAVVWNLFAAPPLSLEAHTWCYPFVGCLPYRGYFDRARVERYERRLRARGLETYIGAVPAYSTLGWFDDPMLSTFMDLDEADFVELLVHELAHSRIWVRGDAAFNESFAAFVGREGTRVWFGQQGRAAEYDAHEKSEAGWQRAWQVLQETRTALASVYGSPLQDEEKAAGKSRILDVAAGCLETLAEQTGNEGYRRLIDRLNNAYLVSLATYTDVQGAFEALFAEAGGNWQAFFDRVEEIGRLKEAERARLLSGSGQDQIAAQRDDAGADEVECETLAGHGFDAEVAGAVHDDVWGGGDG